MMYNRKLEKLKKNIYTRFNLKLVNMDSIIHKVYVWLKLETLPMGDQ